MRWSSNIQRTPEYEAKLLVHAALHGPFVSLKTLLGGDPDCNRRTIYHCLTEERLDVFNAEMREWTPALEAALESRLKELNDAYLAERRKL